MRWQNWSRELRCTPAAIERPASEAEIAAALERAAQAGHRARVAGSGHSFSDVVPTEGLMLLMDRMDRVLDLDRESGLVRVQAGITINALGTVLAEHGLAQENLGDIDVQTI